MKMSPKGHRHHKSYREEAEIKPIKQFVAVTQSVNSPITYIFNPKFDLIKLYKNSSNSTTICFYNKPIVVSEMCEQCK